MGYRIKKIAYDGKFIALTRADNVISVPDAKIIDSEYMWPMRQKIYQYKKLRPIPKPCKSLKYNNKISLERVIRWKDYLYSAILPGDGMKDPGCIDIIYTCLWLTLIIFGIGSIISATSSLIWCVIINLALLMIILGASLFHTCRRRHWIRKCDLNPHIVEEIKIETV
jgi:hypothetical protein